MVKLSEDKKMKKTEKQIARNKARDIIGDYYMTNRKYTAENEERGKNEGLGKGWTRTEKIYMTLIVVGLVLIVVKYVIFR